jgi:hypothetical protein
LFYFFAPQIRFYSAINVTALIESQKQRTAHRVIVRYN